MATIENNVRSTATSNAVDKEAWVVEVLKSDDLRLANSRRLEPYGRAELSRGVKVLLWAMRIYVVLSFVLIAAQIYISLKQ